LRETLGQEYSTQLFVKPYNSIPQRMFGKTIQ
jgi:hypothetical protein